MRQIEAWGKFAAAVSEHIRSYVMPRYGDDDFAEHYTVQQCVDQAEKYLHRVKKGMSRPGEEKSDLMKAAHYAQKAWSKL